MIEFRIPVKTRSLNQSFRGDWRPRAAEAKKQRGAAMAKCPKWPGGPLLHVRITRVSNGTLDGDAVPAACKHVRDGIASRLRIDDASPLVEWHYAQAKGEAEVVVQIWTAGEDAPPVPHGEVSKAKRAPHTPPGKWTPEKVEAFNVLPIRKMSHKEVEEMFPKKRAPRTAYTPPRSTPVDAASEAEATFAPLTTCSCNGCPGATCNCVCHERRATNALSLRNGRECPRFDCDCHHPHARRP